jgi:predicted nicotinamide N-methyase
MMKRLFAFLLLGVPAAAWLSSPRSARRMRVPLAPLCSSDNTNDPDYTGKTLYQRVFYRFSPGSDVDVHDAIVVEERVRFQVDPDNRMIKVGDRKIILRDGQVEDGEIGDDFFTLSTDHTENDMELQSEIVTAMFLASNPSLCSTGRVLEVGCCSGIASLLGCIGAGFVSRRDTADVTVEEKDVAQEILTIGKAKATHDDTLLPVDLEMLVLTDDDERRLNAALHNCKHSGVSPSKVSVELLDWKQRARAGPTKEFNTVVASDISFSFPEAKALARTVANRLAPVVWYDASQRTPRFVHVCPESRDVAYLHRFLSQGYKMSASTGYLNVEKLRFAAQILPTSESSESMLDDLELEVQHVSEIPFQSLIAQHHPDYAGQGSGELFFPMETGAYDVQSGSTYLEPEAGSSPW